MEIILETKQLVKKYGISKSIFHQGTVIHAVDGVSLKIMAGKSLALIGESGSGKSTFGRLTVGLEHPTSGKVIFQEEEIQDLSFRKKQQLRKNMQMIFQSNHIFDPCYTVEESIKEVLLHYKNYSKAEAQETVEQMLQMVGLDKSYGKRYGGELSGGQCQRANIARALILHPRFIVCDEPVSGLDYSVRKQTLNLLNSMKEKFGLTYLLITHDLSNVPYVCEAVAIMYLGKIVEYMDSTKQIEKHALHPYTKMLFQSIPSTNPHERKIIKNASLVEKLNNLGTCSYSSRCPYFNTSCQGEPQLLEIETGHFVACSQIKKM